MEKRRSTKLNKVSSNIFLRKRFHHNLTVPVHTDRIIWQLLSKQSRIGMCFTVCVNKISNTDDDHNMYDDEKKAEKLFWLHVKLKLSNKSIGLANDILLFFHYHVMSSWCVTKKSRYCIQRYVVRPPVPRRLYLNHERNLSTCINVT